MPDPYAKPYLDSSVYIAAIKGEQGRTEIARGILEDARTGKLEVVGSTFVIAEVIRAKGQPAPLSEEDEAKIDQYVFHDFITWVEVDVTLALQARKLSRSYGLRPGDAIHVASALRGGADQVLRWDDKWSEGEYDGVLVCDPHWQGQPEIGGFTAAEIEQPEQGEPAAPKSDGLATQEESPSPER